MNMDYIYSAHVLNSLHSLSKRGELDFTRLRRRISGFQTLLRLISLRMRSPGVPSAR